MFGKLCEQLLNCRHRRQCHPMESLRVSQLIPLNEGEFPAIVFFAYIPPPQQIADTHFLAVWSKFFKSVLKCQPALLIFDSQARETGELPKWPQVLGDTLLLLSSPKTDKTLVIESLTRSWGCPKLRPGTLKFQGLSFKTHHQGGKIGGS